MLNKSKVDKAEDYSRVKKKKKRLEPQQRTDDFFVVRKMIMMHFFGFVSMKIEQIFVLTSHLYFMSERQFMGLNRCRPL
jgi:hypothetical protein